MRFNAKKCYLMSINQKSTHFYLLDGHILQQVPDNPYLGVTLSDNMKWNSHISKISKKATSTLGFLKINLKHCPQDSRRTAYLSLVRSTLEYSSIVWDPYLQKDIDKLEKVQRQAARFITGNYISREQGCVSQMLAELNLPPLQDRRKANRLTFFYKVVEGLGCQQSNLMTFWLLSRENAILNLNNIQTVSLVTSLTNNLRTKVNVLRLSCAILKHTKTHSSSGLSSTGTIWATILCAQIQLTASGKPSIIGTSYSSQLSPVASTLKGPATYIIILFRFRFRELVPAFIFSRI